MRIRAMKKQSQNKPNQTQFQRMHHYKSMNNQSSIEPFVVSLCPVSSESISIRKNFAASKYTAAAEGTTRSNLKMSGQLFESHIAITIAADIHSVAAIVFTNAEAKPSSIEIPASCFRRDRRSSTTRITTCKYEQSAVENASPPVPQTQIKVKFNTILAQTAYRALRTGVLESCIE